MRKSLGSVVNRVSASNSADRADFTTAFGIYPGLILAFWQWSKRAAECSDTFAIVKDVLCAQIYGESHLISKLAKNRAHPKMSFITFKPPTNAFPTCKDSMYQVRLRYQP